MAHPLEQVPYFPERNVNEARTFDGSQGGPTEGILPYGFPNKLVSKMAWERVNVSLDYTVDDESPYLLILQDQQLVEIDAALRHFRSQPATAITVILFSVKAN